MEIVKKLYHFISAMKTGLILLSLIGLASALGSTVLPDNFFETKLFKLLLSLLFLNMILCTTNRLIGLKSVFFSSLKIKPGSFRQLGIFLLHTGIVFIMAGGFLYMYIGQSEQLHIAKDHFANISRIKKPFSLQLDDFQIRFNEDGSVAQYYSYVSVLQEGKRIKKAAISVNHPFTYGGVKAYQTSFGYSIKVKYKNLAGKEVESLFNEGDLLKISGTNRVVKIYRYLPNFEPTHGMTSVTMRPDNPVIIYSIYENDQFLGVGQANLGEKMQLDDTNILEFCEVEPYTVLTVKTDPGLPLVLAGGLMLMAGVLLELLAKPVKRRQ